ncbi:MAG: hypothetical protein QNJ17_08975 [Desulfocapsaceae bacterium]|nr:hypothetical protein [Desulfocapsaceae bacterium]
MSDQLRSGEEKQGTYPVWEVIRESLSEGGLYDSLLGDGNPATIPHAIGLKALGIGFANAEELLNDTTLSELFKSCNRDVLALEEALFLICQSENTLDQQPLEEVFKQFTSSRVNQRTITEYLGGTRRFIHDLYAKYYDRQSLEDFIKQACSKYSREKSLPSGALASRLFDYMGSKNFAKSAPVAINTRNQMLLGMRAMKTFQKSVPEFHQALDDLFSCFPII